MHRPVPHDAERRFERAVEEAPALAGARTSASSALSRAARFDAVGVTLDDFEQALAARSSRPALDRSAEKGLAELRDGRRPGRVLEGGDLEAARRDRRRARRRTSLLAIVLFTFLFMTGSGKATSTVADGRAGARGGHAAPAYVIGPRRPATAWSRSTASASQRGRDRRTSSPSSEGAPLAVTVVRDGEELRLGPARRARDGLGYRLGFGLEGDGLGAVEAVGRAFEVTGIISKEIVFVARTARHGRGPRERLEPDRDHAGVVGRRRARRGELPLGARAHLALARAPEPPAAAPARRRPHPLLLIEGARGRYLKREIYERVSVVGLAVVLLLFFVGLSNDIGRLS